jgi:hypothetical protein
VSAIFARLTTAATNLNAASDQLSKPIEQVEVTLRKLNLGIEAWFRVTGETDYDSGVFWMRSLGYAKVNGNWCIAIRTLSGNLNDNDPSDEELWPFSEAPRALRIEGASKLPDLLEKLIETADKTAATLTETREIVQAVADVMTVNSNAAPRK